jgi:hypothetical protein
MEDNFGYERHNRTNAEQVGEALYQALKQKLPEKLGVLQSGYIANGSPRVVRMRFYPTEVDILGPAEWEVVKATAEEILATYGQLEDITVEFVTNSIEYDEGHTIVIKNK